MSEGEKGMLFVLLFSGTFEPGAELVVAKAVPWFGLLPLPLVRPDPRPTGPHPSNNTQLHASGFSLVGY